MGTYNSSTVQVFPSSHRTQIPDGKFTSETNFANIIRSITDTSLQDGYVLKHSVVDNLLTLEVVIHGYYFKLTSVTATYPLYLGIKVRTGDGRLVNYTDGSGTAGELDVDNKFTALVYDTAMPTNIIANDNYTEYWLQVRDSNGEFVNTMRFSAKSVEYETEEVSVEDKLTDLDTNKQDNLTAGNGISINDIVISLSDYSDIDDVIKNDLDTNDLPIKVNKGVVTRDTATSVGASNQLVYINQGTITAGTTFHASQNVPTSADGNVGDIWFRYY